MAKSKKPRRNQTDKSKEPLDETQTSDTASETLDTAQTALTEDLQTPAQLDETIDGTAAAESVADADAEADAGTTADDTVTDSAEKDPDFETADASAKEVAIDDETPSDQDTLSRESLDDDLASDDLKEEIETNVEEVEADPEPDPVTPPPPQPEPRKSGFLPLFFGGIVAAMLGFILGRADQFDEMLPESMQRKAPDLTALEARTSDLSTQTSDLSAQTDALAAAVAELQAAEPEAAAVDTSALDAAIEELNAKIDALEARPVVEGGSPELEAMVGDLEATITSQAEEIAALRDGVASVTQAEQSAAKETLALAALTRVEAALATGEAYAPALADLEATGVIEIPGELAAAAGDGVPTMASLSSEFPEAARAALAATRSQDANSGGVDLGAFLTRQLGVRSVMPREGDDPDAILSRAEAALRSGDLTGALSELEALPDVAKSELSVWLDQAQTRQIALDAANSMAQSLTAN